MSSLLTRTREALGAAPRSVPTRDNVEPPAWMQPNDPLRASYPVARRLLTEGRVIWGHVVQANTKLFAAGSEDCPADVLFPARGDDDVSIDAMVRASRAAFQLRGRTEIVDPDLARIGAALKAEMERTPVLDLPNAITGGVPMRMTTIMIHRVHLPTRYVSCLALPLLVSEARDAVAVLPARHWAPDLVRAWIDLGASAS